MGPRDDTVWTLPLAQVPAEGCGSGHASSDLVFAAEEWATVSSADSQNGCDSSVTQEGTPSLIKPQQKRGPSPLPVASQKLGH